MDRNKPDEPDDLWRERQLQQRHRFDVEPLAGRYSVFPNFGEPEYGLAYALLGKA